MAPKLLVEYPRPWGDIRLHEVVLIVRLLHVLEELLQARVPVRLEEGESGRLELPANLAPEELGCAESPLCQAVAGRRTAVREKVQLLSLEC